MAPTAFVDWPSALTMSSVGSTLYQQSVAHHYLQCKQDPSPTLDGYAFNCDGIVIGFYQQELYCQGASGGETFDCGSYYYNGLDLVGSTTVLGPFEATNLNLQDELLVSFDINDVTTCNVVSLNWHNYSLVDYFGLQCPIQNVIPNVSFQNNHFAFGVSGDVAVRSPLEIKQQAKIVRDSYGVYQWLDNDSIKLYFGPQQGRQATVLTGTLSNSELHVDGYEPSGPCTHDGTSTLSNTDSLPQLPKPKSVAGRALSNLAKFLSLKAFGVEEMWNVFRKSKSWFLMLRVGLGGAAATPALSMTVTAFLTEILKGEWPRIALHPSFVPLFLDKKNFDKTKDNSSSQ